MRTAKPSTVASILLVVSVAVALSLALAQTSERLPGAREGTSAGSLEVMFAYMNDHDPAHFAEDAEFHVMGAGEPFRGREAIGGALATFYGGAFTDTHVEDRTQLADGHLVVLEFVYSGTHTGEFMGIPATDRRVTIPMMGIYEIRDGRIQVVRLYYDTATMLRQLGQMDQ